MEGNKDISILLQIHFRLNQAQLEELVTLPPIICLVTAHQECIQDKTSCSILHNPGMEEALLVTDLKVLWGDTTCNIIPLGRQAKGQ